MKHQTRSSEQIAKLDQLIKGIKVAMMTTMTDDGLLRSRPMATLDRPFDGDLWFFTDANANKVYEIEQEHEVNISYSAPSDNRYVSVSGTADLVRDRRKIKKLWNPMLKAWFPKGVDDPNLALLRVRVESAEYWASPSGAVVRLIGLAKAVLGGKRYQGELSDHGKLEMEVRG